MLSSQAGHSNDACNAFTCVKMSRLLCDSAYVVFVVVVPKNAKTNTTYRILRMRVGAPAALA